MVHAKVVSVDMKLFRVSGRFVWGRERAITPFNFPWPSGKIYVFFLEVKRSTPSSTKFVVCFQKIVEEPPYL